MKLRWPRAKEGPEFDGITITPHMVFHFGNTDKPFLIWRALHGVLSPPCFISMYH